MLTQKRLKEILHYVPITGKFVRKGRVGARGKTVKCRKADGVNGNGYTHIRVDGVKHKAHRLAFLFMCGYFPENQVDHLNGIRNDNRWKNLKHVTQCCNLQNCRISKNNKSGFPGVTWQGSNGKWVANIRINTKRIYLGIYSTRIEAALARLTFETQCSSWNCNHRGELVKAIKKSWPEFNDRCL